MKNPKEPVKCVAYCRVSTLLGQNPENQAISIREFARSRSFDLIAEYVDRGISGSREKRPALDQMVENARRGRFGIVIVTALDRLGRDSRHLTVFT